MCLFFYIVDLKITERKKKYTKWKRNSQTLPITINNRGMTEGRTAYMVNILKFIQVKHEFHQQMMNRWYWQAKWLTESTKNRKQIQRKNGCNQPRTANFVHLNQDEIYVKRYSVMICKTSSSSGRAMGFSLICSNCANTYRIIQMRSVVPFFFFFSYFAYVYIL